MRIGAKKRPFYRVVAVDERAKRNGAYIELLGTYNPLTEPHEINLKKDRIDYWLKQGAVKSDGFLRILGEAPQRPPRKPKKERKEEAPVVAPVVESVKSESAETSDEVEPTLVVNESGNEEGGQQISSEATEEKVESGEPSDVSRPDEQTPTKETPEPTQTEEKTDERPA